MKSDFCFIVISYNQEKYVECHLDSIKFIVNQYADGRKIQIIFSDDASSDATVLVARRWLEKNNDLFAEINIVEHSENVGTIENLYGAIKKCNAGEFKFLACDDLYYKNNIFELYNNCEIVLSPTIQFYENMDLEKNLTAEFIRFLKYRDRNIQEKIRKMLRFSQCIPAPGVFANKNIWMDEGLWNFVRKFKYIEDVPMFHYVFNNYKNVTVNITSCPYVLYRRGVGVSTKINHEADNPIDREYRNIRKKIKSKEESIPKYINPYVYANYFLNHYMKKIWIKKLQEDISIWNENVAGLNEYFAMLGSCRNVINI